MSENVRVPDGDSRAETATLLLAAAEESEDFNVDAVQVSSYGGFVVPEEIAKEAGLDYEPVEEAMGHVYSDAQVNDAGEIETPTEASATEEPKPAKKTPAKKAAAKKAGGKR